MIGLLLVLQKWLSPLSSLELTIHTCHQKSKSISWDSPFNCRNIFRDLSGTPLKDIGPDPVCMPDPDNDPDAGKFFPLKASLLSTTLQKVFQFFNNCFIGSKASLLNCSCFLFLQNTCHIFDNLFYLSRSFLTILFLLSLFAKSLPYFRQSVWLVQKLSYFTQSAFSFAKSLPYFRTTVYLFRSFLTLLILLSFFFKCVPYFAQTVLFVQRLPYFTYPATPFYKKNLVIF